MEQAARRFARWVLTIHVLLLVGVVAVVCFAAREVYSSARQEALNQASKRQMLLAEQTARGIESFYSSILDNFDLVRRAEESDESHAEEPARRMLRSGEAGRLFPPGVLWQQLKHRASHFLIVDRATLQPLRVFPQSNDFDRNAPIVENSANWLRGGNAPQVSGKIKLGGTDVNLVCVPVTLAGGAQRLLVGVVPLAKIEEQFLHGVNTQEPMSAMLLDEQMRVMVANDPQVVGLSIPQDTSNPQIRAVAERYLELGKPGTEVLEKGFRIGGREFESGMVSIQPIEIRDKRWWLTIGSTLNEVNSVVASTFRSALAWAIFVVGSVTAILVSTAIEMIRSRVRLERVRHDLLTRELTQARQIQLAWLPKNDDDPEHIDLCAANKPASHVSGDFYNWFDLPDGRVCVVIGDVTGHGMSAAFLMATTQLLVRMTMPRLGDPGPCLSEVNRQLCQQVFNGQFVTMEILVLDRINARVDIASAGHPPPLVGRGARFEPLEAETGLVLGVDATTEYVTETFDLPDNAAIVLYTDGVIDAQAPDESRFGIEGLGKCVFGRFDNAQAILDCIIESVDEFRNGRELGDDLTLVTIQLQPVPQPKTPVVAMR
jgi:serine phosphatase RsbU (regulator of sigma subunit)